MVAPFVEPPPPVAPQPLPQQKSPPVDVPVGRQLDKGRTSAQRAAPVEVPTVEAPRPAATVSVWTGSPDRLKIAALANKHFPEVVKGDTNASYAVMVFDAADNYVWGTYGSGAVQLVIGGDKRPPAERAESSFKYTSEYM